MVCEMICKDQRSEAWLKACVVLAQLFVCYVHMTLFVYKRKFAHW